MELEKLYQPISAELKKVEGEIRFQVKDILGGLGLGPRSRLYMGRVMSYILQSSGKLLRPALVLLSAGSANGGRLKEELPLIKLSASVELVHNASLIHDDIIDESALRRDRLTLARRFDNKVAVLIGDILFAQFVEILINLTVDPTKRKRLLNLFSGITKQMCSGEILENKVKKSAVSLLFESFDQYFEVIKLKTASLMAASCRGGAILADADARTEQLLEEYGLNLGLTYQVVDDYIDGDAAFGSKTEAFDRIRLFARRAEEAAALLKESVFREKLIDLIDYVVERAAVTVK